MEINYEFIFSEALSHSRREKLLLAGDSTWLPLSIEDVEEIEKRKRLVRNKCKKREPIPDQDE